MPIKNRGSFSLDQVFERQVNQDWPAANTDFDLYVQDLIAAGNVIANGLIIRNIEVADDVLAGNVIAEIFTGLAVITDGLVANSVYAKDFILTDGYVVANGLIIRNIEVADDVLTGNILSEISFTDSLFANVITTNAIIAAEYVNLNTANVPESSSNLYFTVNRARDVFTAGEGINISSNGVIKARLEDAGKGLFNSGMTEADFKLSQDSFSEVSSFTGSEGTSFIVYSVHATNITSEDAYLTGRYVLGSNNVLFANVLRIPGDTSLELLRKAQIFKPSDKIEILSYDSTGTAGNDLISVFVSYQSISDDRYNRIGTTISNQSLNTIFISDSRPSVVESISLNNLEDVTAPVTLIVTDENDVVKAYLTSNLRIPPKASVEICEYPKTIPTGYKIKANKFTAGDLSIFASSKFTAQYTIDNSTGVINEGQTVIFDITTLGVNPGATLYYTVEGIQGNVNSNDFTTPMDGSFVVGDGTATVIVTANSDLNIDIEGDEIFKLYLRTGSVAGTIVAMSPNVILKDTSNISPYSASEDITLTYSGNSNVNIFVAGINNTTTIYYEIEEV
jgi:hypothetical protein